MKNLILTFAFFLFSVNLTFGNQPAFVDTIQLAGSSDFYSQLLSPPYSDLTGFIVSPAETKSTVQNDLCSCVIWIRNNRVSSLPTGLNTLQDKINIINFGFPAVGSV